MHIQDTGKRHAIYAYKLWLSECRRHRYAAVGLYQDSVSPWREREEVERRDTERWGEEEGGERGLVSESEWRS